MEQALATFRKGQTVTVHTASYISRASRAPQEGTVERTTKAGEVHVKGWEFPFSAASGRQILPTGYDKPLTSTAWIEI